MSNTTETKLEMGWYTFGMWFMSNGRSDEYKSVIKSLPMEYKKDLVAIVVFLLKNGCDKTFISDGLKMALDESLASSIMDAITTEFINEQETYNV